MVTASPKKFTAKIGSMSSECLFEKFKNLSRHYIFWLKIKTSCRYTISLTKKNIFLQKIFLVFELFLPSFSFGLGDGLLKEAKFDF